MSAEADWIRRELVHLWYDFIREERLSLVPRASGQWSMKQEAVGERIKEATALVGPINWHEIPIPKLTDGWFERMNRLLGIDARLPTAEELDNLRTVLGP